MRSFSFLPSRLILVHPLHFHVLVPFRPTSSPSAPSHTPLCLSVPYHPRQPLHFHALVPFRPTSSSSVLQSHTLLPFHFIQHFVPPLRFFSPCPRPSGKVPGSPAKTVHFTPWPTGTSAPQASLAALAVSYPGESAGFFCENGSLFPEAGWGIGSTDLSRGICRLSLRGKCREFRRKRFTFPRGRQGHRLHRHLSQHSPFPPPGKVPGFSAKTVHFPPWPTGVPALQVPLAALAVSTSEESAGFFRENGSLSPVANKDTGSTGLSGGTRHFHLPGKCREFPRKRFTFPRGS